MIINSQWEKYNSRESGITLDNRVFAVSTFWTEFQALSYKELFLSSTYLSNQCTIDFIKNIHHRDSSSIFTSSSKFNWYLNNKFL